MWLEWWGDESCRGGKGPWLVRVEGGGGGRGSQIGEGDQNQVSKIFV